VAYAADSAMWPVPYFVPGTFPFRLAPARQLRAPDFDVTIPRITPKL
jgi:hypothetical protein